MCESSERNSDRALNHRIFKALCESVGQKHTVLLYETFMKKLAFLADMFTHLNNLNLSMQGRGVRHSDLQEKN